MKHMQPAKTKVMPVTMTTRKPMSNGSLIGMTMTKSPTTKQAIEGIVTNNAFG